MKIVIIGGVAGGATAAARLRRLDEKAEIIVLERSGYVSYANCGLPYYIGGEIQEKEALTLQTPQSFYDRFRIDVRVKNEVTKILPKEKKVQVLRLEDGTTYEESYDKLILSPGAKPLKPNLPGVDEGIIFTLRTVEDTFAIREYIEKHHPKTAVVAGGGYIGLEMAENLVQMGVAPTIVQRPDHVMAPLDYDMACQIHSYLKTKGVSLCLGTTVEGFEQRDGKMITLLKDERHLTSDMVILAIGVVPETHLAKEAGLELGIKGSIVVNDRMETSCSDIYAVGDAVEVKHFVTGAKALISLAGPANKQGRIAADNICGRDSRFTGSQGSSIIKIFGMTAAVTGINEKTAKAAGIPFDKVITMPPSHATYYPGARNMTIKTLFHPETGKILGAQIVGFEGVDKRIDVMATAIRAGMDATDLTELDLSYAPPYSSAKDPVNMAGYVIENLLTGVSHQYQWYDVETLPRDGSVTLLDTRTRGEYARGHIPGTINIPLDELREHLDELDVTKPIYVNCHSGQRSYIACRILQQNGFTCYNLAGGFRFYQTIMEDKFDGTPTHPCGIAIEKN